MRDPARGVLTVSIMNPCALEFHPRRCDNSQSTEDWTFSDTVPAKKKQGHGYHIRQVLKRARGTCRAFAAILAVVSVAAIRITALTLHEAGVRPCVAPHSKSFHPEQGLSVTVFAILHVAAASDMEVIAQANVAIPFG